MDKYHSHKCWIVWFSFFIATILQIVPLPVQLYPFCPSWTKLLLIYWITALPNRVNIGTGFILGLITDLTLNSTLGVRALAFSMLAYLTVLQFHLFYNMMIWQQILFVIILSSITQLIIFLIELLIINSAFNLNIFWSSIIDGMLWPFLLFLMRKIHYRFVTP